jgi:hypothetical protein
MYQRQLPENMDVCEVATLDSEDLSAGARVIFVRREGTQQPQHTIRRHPDEILVILNQHEWQVYENGQDPASGAPWWHLMRPPVPDRPADDALEALRATS